MKAMIRVLYCEELELEERAVYRQQVNFFKLKLKVEKLFFRICMLFFFLLEHIVFFTHATAVNMVFL